jgi:hypothetical protein
MCCDDESQITADELRNFRRKISDDDNYDDDDNNNNRDLHKSTNK